ncbi:MAG: lipoate--protein ligase, partial [Tetragenococcus halophilus]|nr:lipoate--protein ligase [Tetragenococcus halophilus]
MLVNDSKVIVGGTLLLDADYKTLEQVLTPNKKKLAAKGVKSVQSRVTALRPYLAKEHRDITIEAFRKLLIKELKLETYFSIRIPWYTKD